MIGWRGHVPLPFQVSDSICQDTDDDTKYQCLKDAQSGKLKGSGKGNNTKGSDHYYRVQQLLRSLIPMEWFPTIAQIISEQLKLNNTDGAKTDSFMTNSEDHWTPGSLQRVDDHIKEIEIIREVALMAAYINNQVEDFSKSPLTKESVKSMRTMLFSKNGPGGSYLKNLILHNVRLQHADKIVGTENEAKALQHDFDLKMTEEMADIITANVLTQMAEIVDNDAEFAPLTEDDYRKIKNFETDIVKDGSDPNVKQYLLKLIHMEADNEQKEPTRITEEPPLSASPSQPPETKLAQQTPLPWPIHSNTTTKKGVTWQAPQMLPTPKEDMLPSGPLPQPPPMSEDTPGHHHISFTAEAQGD